MRVGHGIDVLGTVLRIIPERQAAACNPASHRFLIVKLSSIGDVIHALPVASALRRRFPSARITWAIEEWTAPLVAGHPAVDRVIVFPTMVRWPANPRAWANQLKRAGRELRSETYDAVLDLQGLARSAVIARLARSPLRLARAGQREGAHLVSAAVALPKRPIHAVEEYLHVARHLGASMDNVTFDLPVHDDARRSMSSMLAGHDIGASVRPIVVNPSSAQRSKQWAARSWAAVIEWLTTAGPVVLIGAPSSCAAHAVIVQLVTRPVVDLTGRTTLAEAVALLERASLHVSPDTGTAHIAAALGTPVVCVYGPTDPTRVGPYGQAAGVVHHRDRCGSWCTAYCHRNRACLQAVTPAEVIRRIQEVRAASCVNICGALPDTLTT